MADKPIDLGSVRLVNKLAGMVQSMRNWSDSIPVPPTPEFTARMDRMDRVLTELRAEVYKGRVISKDPRAALIK